MNPQRGMALVVVLWVVTLLAVMAGSFSLSMRRESSVIRNLTETVQARYLAEAGVRHAMLELLNPDMERRWQGDGTVHEIPMGPATVKLAVLDESGKIDLNSASDALLDGLLRSVGVGEEQRQALVGAILDWRDPGHLHRLHGAGEQDYKNAGLPYGPRNGSFQSIEELQLVLGMTPALYRRLEPWITIYSGQGGINPAVAPRQVLLALPGISTEQVDAYLEQRYQHRAQGLPPPPLTGGGAQMTGGGGSAYSVTSIARLPSGTRAGIEVVLASARGTSTSSEPFVELNWKELDLSQVRMFERHEATD